MSTWKAVERRLATLLGGKRVPVSGRQRGDSPDIEHKTLSLEIKHRKTIPAWIHDAIDQARKSSTNGKLPVVILHESNARHDNDAVVIPLREFVEWLKQRQ